MTRCIHLRAWLVKYGMRAQKEKTARSKNIPGGKMVEFSFSDDFSEFLRKCHMWQRPNAVDTAETAMTKRILQMLDTLSTIDFCSCPTQLSLLLRSLKFGFFLAIWINLKKYLSPELLEEVEANLEDCGGDKKQMDSPVCNYNSTFTICFDILIAQTCQYRRNAFEI